MKSQDTVSKEVRRVVLGTSVLTALMLLVFVLVGRSGIKVWFGALYGYILAAGNFVLLAYTVHKIADSADVVDEDTTKAAKLRIQKSYSMRMLACAVLLVVALAVFRLNWVACCLPLVFPRIIITFRTAHDRIKKVKGSDIK